MFIFVLRVLPAKGIISHTRRNLSVVKFFQIGYLEIRIYSIKDPWTKPKGGRIEGGKWEWVGWRRVVETTVLEQQ